jgi:transcriptional regulator with XRE-family HTH domain
MNNIVKGIDLKILRLKAGIRQYDLAVQIGIAPNRLSEIESGRRQPSDDVLKKLFNILKYEESTEGRDINE